MQTDSPVNPVIKDSGTRREFSTGSRRDAQSGKGRFDLLPVRALFRLAKHFEAGSAKYGDRNWEKGQPLSVYLDSGIRHALKHLAGLRDEDHAAAALWNFACMVDTEERIREGLLPAELNDLPETLKHLPPVMFPPRPAHVAEKELPFDPDAPLSWEFIEAAPETAKFLIRYRPSLDDRTWFKAEGDGMGVRSSAVAWSRSDVLRFFGSSLVSVSVRDYDIYRVE